MYFMCPFMLNVSCPFMFVFSMFHDLSCRTFPFLLCFMYIFHIYFSFSFFKFIFQVHFSCSFSMFMFHVHFSCSCFIFHFSCSCSFAHMLMFIFMIHLQSMIHFYMLTRVLLQDLLCVEDSSYQ